MILTACIHQPLPNQVFQGKLVYESSKLYTILHPSNATTMLNSRESNLGKIIYFKDSLYILKIILFFYAYLMI